MCGIAGIIRDGAAPDSVATDLGRMWPGIASRGPDGRGQLVARGVGLLHSRLAIIDLVTGEQPVWNERRTVACVFNGEIYNYRELRERLRGRGHTLATTTDTEVLVHLYEEYGSDVVDHVHGMYAFAIHDVESQRVLLARDRLGIKPLYLADLEGGLAFASSIRSLLALGLSREPDSAALAQYFQFYKIPEPRTAFRSVRTLLPGHLLDCDVTQKRFELRRFYSIASLARRSRGHGRGGEREAAARRCFERAVASHMVADVEIGAFLSGGIDSTLVVAQAQRLSTRPLRTFSVSFEGGAIFDESPFAESVARALGTRHETIRVNAAPPALLRDALAATHQPFAIASFLPLLRLCSRAAREVKVVLTGDGGDEVGMGYPWHRWMQWLQRLHLGSGGAGPVQARHLLDLERRLSTHPRFRALRRALKFARGAALGGARASDAWRYDLDDAGATSLLASEHRPPRGESSPTDAAWPVDLPPLDALQVTDLEVLLRDEMLPKLDRAGMAFGLEGRVPLLDDEFVVAMMAVPAATHLAHPRGKALLRSWARELCPAVDVRRRKHGFDVPMHDWLVQTLRPDIDRLLLHRARPGLTDAVAARSTEARMKAGVSGAAHTLFAMLMAELWYEQIAEGR